MVNRLPRIEDHLHQLQNIILHERYVESYFSKSRDDFVDIVKKIEKLKYLYERKVLDKMYLKAKDKNGTHQPGKIGTDTKVGTNITEKNKVLGRNNNQDKNFKSEPNNVLMRRSKISQKQTNEDRDSEKLDINSELTQIFIKTLLPDQEKMSKKNTNYPSYCSNSKTRSWKEPNTSCAKDVATKDLNDRKTFKHSASVDTSKIQRHSLEVM